MKGFLEKIIKQVSFRLVFAIVTLIISLYVIVIVLHELFMEKEYELDHNVLAFLEKYNEPWLHDLMLFFSFFGKPDFLIPAYIILIFYFIIRKKKAYAIQVLILGVTSTALLFGLKELFQRDRPEIPIFEHLSGYSFPSGHALIGFVFCSILVYMAWKSQLSNALKIPVIIFLLLFSLMIGISRIILKVHYTTDVIVGFCIGYIWALFFLWVFNRRKKHEI